MPQKKHASTGKRTGTSSSRSSQTGRSTSPRNPSPNRQTRGKRSTADNGELGRPMLENLEDGFFTELADMMDAEGQVLKVLHKMANASNSRRLRQLFEMHAEQTEEQISRLERVFRMFDQKPHAERCEGIQGIVTEGEELLEKTAEGPVRDAMIIAAAQKIEHYEISSYGTLCAWAEELGARQAVRLLEETLREEKNADWSLSRIAEWSMNERAEMGQGRERARGRGRYEEDWPASGIHGPRDEIRTPFNRDDYERETTEPRFAERQRGRGRERRYEE